MKGDSSMASRVKFNDGTIWELGDNNTVVWVRDYADRDYIGAILHVQLAGLKIHCIGGCLKPFDRTIKSKEEL